MILLDTTVMADLMHDSPSQALMSWFVDLPDTPLGLASITVAELRDGIASLPDGRRKAGLEQALNGVLTIEFDGLILPFDTAAAEAYGLLAARHRAAGLSTAQGDLMTAAIALATGARIATGQGARYAQCGVELLDPFSGATGPQKGRHPRG